MGMISWIRERLEQTEVISRLVPSWKKGKALARPTDFRRLMDEGYRKNVISYVCIREIATSAAEPELKVTQKARGEDLPVPDANPLVQLLLNPNDEQSQYDWLEEGLTHLESSGNWYIHKVRSGVGMVVQVWNLQPDRMTVKLGDTGRVESYLFDKGSGEKVAVPGEDVIHIKLPDPLQPYYGLAPIAVAAAWGDMDSQAAEYLRAFFLNAGRPQGLLKLKTRVAKKESDRIKANWRDEYQGTAGWHTVAVLDANAEYQDVGSRPDQLDLGSVFSESESRICGAYGVPPIIVGTRIGLLQSTYANYQEARRSFWYETLSPMYQKIDGALTKGLASEFGGNLSITFDLSNVPALQEDLEAVRKFGIEGWKEGVLWRNEARAVIGFDPVQGGDMFKPDPKLVGEIAAHLPPHVLMDGIDRVGPPVLPGIPVEFVEEDGDFYAVYREGEVGKVGPPEKGGSEVHAVPSDDPMYRIIHALSEDRWEEMSQILLDAVKATQDQISITALTRALQTGSVDQALAAIPWEDTAFQVMMDPMTEELLAMVEAAGLATIGDFTGKAGVEMAFDVSRPGVTVWARDHAAKLVAEITAQTQAGLKNTIVELLLEVEHPRGSARTLAKFVTDQVGLTTKQQGYVVGFKDSMLEEIGKGDAIAGFERIQKKYRLSPLRSPKDLTAERLPLMTERYQKNWLDYRGETIGRTETLRAGWQGHKQTWNQAINDGLVKLEEVWKEWIVTPDDRLRPSHAQIPVMNPQGVRFDELFDSPDGPVDQPPFGVLCRCGVTYQIIQIEVPK